MINATFHIKKVKIVFFYPTNNNIALQKVVFAISFS